MYDSEEEKQTGALVREFHNNQQGYILWTFPIDEINVINDTMYGIGGFNVIECDL